MDDAELRSLALECALKTADTHNSDDVLEVATAYFAFLTGREWDTETTPSPR